METFNIDGLFRVSDHEVPSQTEHAMRGLLAPFESLFPELAMPVDRQAALECMDLKRPAAHPVIPFAIRDWVEWVHWEVELRLTFAVRFLMLRKRLASMNRPPPMILFLRAFRAVTHTNKDGIGFDEMSGPQDGDVTLRERMEEMFSDCFVFWIANPKDALSYCFRKDISPNTYPYVASDRWMARVEAMARAANLIVMANTGSAKAYLEMLERLDEDEPAAASVAAASDDGVAREIALIKKTGLMPRTYFARAEALGHRFSRPKDVKDLSRESLSRGARGNYKAIVKLPPMSYWSGPTSSTYAAQYIEAIDRLWGDVQDSGRTIDGNAYAALFIAMSTLCVFRGELAGAANLQLGLAARMQRTPDFFGGANRVAGYALEKSANWYKDKAKLFGQAFNIPFAENP